MESINDSLKLLQKLVGLKARDKRGIECLKNPERLFGDKDEWFIYVPPCFNNCLDIAKTDKKIKGKARKVWTQGSRFSFHRGCILYDTSKAYHKWDVAINKIKYCILIQSAKDVKFEKGMRMPGEVVFSIFSPRYMEMSLESIGEFERTQDEFVRFLINGDPNIISKERIGNNKL